MPHGCLSMATIAPPLSADFIMMSERWLRFFSWTNPGSQLVSEENARCAVAAAPLAGGHYYPVTACTSEVLQGKDRLFYTTLYERTVAHSVETITASLFSIGDSRLGVLLTACLHLQAGFSVCAATDCLPRAIAVQCPSTIGGCILPHYCAPLHCILSALVCIVRVADMAAALGADKLAIEPDRLPKLIPDQ